MNHHFFKNTQEGVNLENLTPTSLDIFLTEFRALRERNDLIFVGISISSINSTVKTLLTGDSF